MSNFTGSGSEGATFTPAVAVDATTEATAVTTIVNKTSNSALQSTLLAWTLQLDEIKETNISERNDLMMEFVRGFAPGDVDEEDILAFSEQLCSDEEFFNSMHREIHQCESGNNVESIQGGQVTSAIFTLKPMNGQLNGGGNSLDIVREVTFILDPNAGGNWRAEG